MMNEMMGLEGLLGCLEGTYFWGYTWLEWSWGVRALKTVSSKCSSARNSSEKGNALRGESGGGRMLVVLGNGWHCQWKQSLRSTAVANSSHTESSNAWLNIRERAWALSHKAPGPSWYKASWINMSEGDTESRMHLQRRETEFCLM